ncbi:hypothetical protein HCU64_21575 [Methylobacterium sp. C25]|uniref:hypothetical protein n=1 Tax=Methylobacterium sp. C25 TaxID=2721622 RepID=UPI001F23667E|nr:hypothetical protein [Methylobacterium sp. C25]MCE4226342.1 hypothetical protein [Methylobacterium sp. C25]
MSIGTRVFRFVLGAVLMGLVLMGVGLFSPGLSWAVIGTGAGVFGLMTAFYEVLNAIPVIRHVVNGTLVSLADVLAAILFGVFAWFQGFDFGSAFFLFIVASILVYIIYVFNTRTDSFA